MSRVRKWLNFSWWVFQNIRIDANLCPIVDVRIRVQHDDVKARVVEFVDRLVIDEYRSSPALLGSAATSRRRNVLPSRTIPD